MTIAAKPSKKVNLRTPEVMQIVQSQVENHYRSTVVERLRARGGSITVDGVSIKLAQQFGFCYGVERAIDLAYAARKVFPDARLFILGEIIHNPEVNDQIRAMGIKNLIGASQEALVEDLTPDDVVIVPAFGAEVETVRSIRDIGCQIVDTTCGDVMSVWKRVRQNSRDAVTSIIHGKANHEETKATSSHAIGDGTGHYLVVLNLAETDVVCDYIVKGGNKADLLARFEGAYSPGFDPDVHLRTVGVANQTTMMRGETEEVQRRIQNAIKLRDGESDGEQNYRFFDTICGATQERQDALRDMLVHPMDLLVVVGGYNSSNTFHLAEMGEERLPTYFIRNASRMESKDRIVHFNLHLQHEVATEKWLPDAPLTIGVTAGASCPNNLIEETILRLFKLSGVSGEDLLSA